MRSTLLTLQRFEELKTQRGAYITAYQSARKHILNSINYIPQEQADRISHILNAIVQSSQFSDSKITSSILNKLPSVAKKAAEDGASELFIADGSSFKTTTKNLSASWAAYHARRAELEKTYNYTKDQLKTDAGLKALQTQALSIQGAVNRIQGDVFESFLQEVAPFISAETEELGHEVIATLINQLASSIDSKDILTTSGANQRTLSFDFGEKTIKISSSQKTDVTIPSPFTDGEFWNISAKSYGHLTDISLVSNASVLGLVSQWPLSSAAQSYFINSLTVYDPQPSEVWVQGKMLMAMQSLVGVSASVEPLANLLVVNTNSKKTPIRVVSTRALLETLNENNFSDMFTVKFSSQLPLFAGGDDVRTGASFQSRVRALTTSIKLSRRTLYLHALRKMLT